MDIENAISRKCALNIQLTSRKNFKVVFLNVKIDLMKIFWNIHATVVFFHNSVNESCW